MTFAAALLALGSWVLLQCPAEALLLAAAAHLRSGLRGLLEMVTDLRRSPGARVHAAEISQAKPGKAVMATST